MLENFKNIIKNRINKAYGYPDNYKTSIPYWYKGQFVEEMTIEEASNIVQTELTYPA